MTLRTIMLMPTNVNVGLTSISLGIIKAMKRNNIVANIFKPISKTSYCSETNMQDKISEKSKISLSDAEFLFKNNQKDILVEKIIDKYKTVSQNTNIILIEGISLIKSNIEWINLLNYEIANVLNAEIIFLVSSENNTLIQLKKKIQFIYMQFGGEENKNILGFIINKFNVSNHDKKHADIFDIFNKNDNTIKYRKKNFFSDLKVPILSFIPWNHKLITIRAIDICDYLNAHVLNPGNIYTNKIKSIFFCTENILNTLKFLIPNTLLIMPTDRPDLFITTCFAILSGIKIGAILLTNYQKSNDHLINFCHSALKTGLPIFTTHQSLLNTAFILKKFTFKMPKDDLKQKEYIKNYIANCIDVKWIKSFNTIFTRKKKYVSSSMFKYTLSNLAKKENKCIVLPEGEESRTIKAASICAERSIAQCILLGDPVNIKKTALLKNISLNKKINIINPKNIRKNYVERLMQLRIKKGITKSIASKKLKDNVVLGTMMLENNEVDGLVSGAIHTTANTIRPSLELIKTSSKYSLISSIFFMLLPDKVLLYADCAINPNPTIEQLAEIAIQSAHSAIQFGIDPRIAMISYATGDSSQGIDVDKVRHATNLVKKKCPHFIIDGPLQYDAAIDIDIAKAKAPHSPIKGQATVLIFPDLNTGNTTYKAVQRSANILSIGPMLQGMKKPVNDLSRGASVDDIVYTIALTVIQASKNK